MFRMRRLRCENKTLIRTKVYPIRSIIASEKIHTGPLAIMMRQPLEQHSPLQSSRAPMLNLLVAMKTSGTKAFGNSQYTQRSTELVGFACSFISFNRLLSSFNQDSPLTHQYRVGYLTLTKKVFGLLLDFILRLIFWWKECEKVNGKVGIISHQSWSVSMIFYTKLYK